MIAANNSHILAFDNLSSLPDWLSDALCRLASGGSFALRQLYTDADEVLFQAARPTILNGIEEVITRQDLADRAIFLAMVSVSGEQRRPEAELWREFELARPYILGALLDAMAHGLRRRHRIRLDRLPRMADFALWAAACETAFWSPGTFLTLSVGAVCALPAPVLEAAGVPQWPCGPHARYVHGRRKYCLELILRLNAFDDG